MTGTALQAPAAAIAFGPRLTGSGWAAVVVLRAWNIASALVNERETTANLLDAVPGGSDLAAGLGN
jgi:hypothetical protein